MIIYVNNQNILDSNCDAIVNTVNTVGVMGKGLAKEYKKKYPVMFQEYKRYCEEKKIEIGNLHWYKAKDGKTIINFPTKEHWRKPSKIEYIEKGLYNLRTTFKQHSIKSVAIPPLGCGNGGLHWSDIRPLIENNLADLDLDIYIYESSEFINTKLRSLLTDSIKFFEDLLIIDSLDNELIKDRIVCLHDLTELIRTSDEDKKEKQTSLDNFV